MGKYSIEQIRENKYNIEGIRYECCFYWVDYVDEETETIYAFTLDDDFKVDFNISFKELSESNDVIIYEYREVEPC